MHDVPHRVFATFTAIVAFASACACTTPDRSSASAGGPACSFLTMGFGDCPLDPYAAGACQAFVDCWGPCQTTAECAACIEPLATSYQEGDLPAFDLGVCMEESCHHECTDQDAETCRACTNAACANYVAICEGRATYPDFEDGDSCYDIGACTDSCSDSDCWASCYWNGSSDARVRYWHLLWAYWGPCGWACGEGGSGCWGCVNRELVVGDAIQCLDDPTPTGCEGLEGVALCMCATNDASFCATL